MKTILLALLVVLVAASARAQQIAASDCFEWRVDRLVPVTCIDPTPEPEQHPTLFHALIAGGIALQGADAMQTAYVIGTGRGHEVNPVLQPFSAHPAAFGAVKLGIAAASSWAIVKAHQSPKYRWIAVALLAEEYAVETYCIVHNQRVLRQVAR
jgi:hypothetical protein